MVCSWEIDRIERKGKESPKKVVGDRYDDDPADKWVERV